MRGGRQALCGQRCVGREGGAGGGFGQCRPRQVAPQQAGKVRHGRRVEWQARQHRHPALACEPPIALRVAGAAFAPVAVHVQAGRHSGVGLAREEMGIGPVEPRVQRAERGQIEVPVDTLQGQSIGAGGIDDGQNRDDLRVVTGQNVG